MDNTTPTVPSNFIGNIITEELETGKIKNPIITRFPPEPNGYLHIGHAKSICLNFGIAQKFNGQCNLRFDDTNPSKEEQEYVDSIIEDLQWLGFKWGEKPLFASDYFEQMFDLAMQLVKNGMAYVCDLTPEQIREYRGTLKEPGKESPCRSRTVEENVDLLQKMRDGEFKNGTKVLRAKIDMASPNLNLRDPIMYRILHEKHHRTGNDWCIYPMYDWAHGLEDSIEGITHSLCTLEFEDHRPLYDWFLQNLGVHHPRQIEFARLNLTYTLMSKRKLLELVKEGHVTGWDDPRMPTISGLRRRGYTPESIQNFCERIGVAKATSTVDVALLEHCVREDLNKKANRYMGVLRPLKVIIENYPEGQTEELEAVNNPEDPEGSKRKIPFSRTLYIEQDDFMEEPVKKFFRLAPGREVRLRYAYFLTCKEVVKNDAGEIMELLCTYDPETKGGNAPDGRKVKATMHWVSADHALKAEVRLYDRLFLKENPDEAEEGLDWRSNLNKDSVEVLSNCYVEPHLKEIPPGTSFQFERLGYFSSDSREFSAQNIVFNRTTTLRDAWAKIKKKK